MENKICRIVNMPITINGITIIDSNGDYNIYINANLSSQAQKEAFDHECKHIKKNHFYSNKHVTKCEEETKI